MTLNHSINGTNGSTNSNDPEILDAGREYKRQFNYVQEHKTLDGYEDKLGLHPTAYAKPEQYYAWLKLMKLIGGEDYNIEKLIDDFHWQVVKQNSEDVFFINNFNKLLTTGKNLELVFSCGFFWKEEKSNRRHKILEFIANNIKDNGWDVTIYTQDEQLEDDFRDKFGVKPNITVVEDRRNIHFVVVKNRSYMENSHVFLELPHTEKYFPRLDTYISFGDVQRNFKCDIIEFLDFLDNKWKEGQE